MPLVAESGFFSSCTRVASSVVALLCIHQVPKATIAGADPGFVERGGAAATASAAGAKVFGGSRLKTLFGISKGGGGGRAPPAPPPLNPLVYSVYICG